MKRRVQAGFGLEEVEAEEKTSNKMQDKREIANLTDDASNMVSDFRTNREGMMKQLKKWFMDAFTPDMAPPEDIKMHVIILYNLDLFSGEKVQKLDNALEDSGKFLYPFHPFTLLFY